MDENPADPPPAEALVSLGGAATSEGSPDPPARLRDALAPGALLGGRYRVERFLARGGMGEVHAAHDQLLDVALALKTLRLDLEGDPLRLKRFKRELLLARSITHPNVCRVYDLEVDRSTRRVLFFLTMELLAGETLRSRVVSRGRMTPEQALPVIRQMATALQAAHAAGIVHRDFKSANVMLVPTGGGERVVVTDFGLADAAPGIEAVAASAATETGGLVGTPAYMAPEQMRGERAGPAADLYALGVVIFEMMTGALPFPGATHEVALERLHRDAPSPRTIVPDLDERFEAVILRLLAREQRERFATATDVVRSLEGASAVVVPRHNLPAERDAFVGRDAELADLARRIDGGARLLTLVGAGGSGKTRLARRFAWTTLDRFPGGACFADLSEARDIDGVLGAVATALEVPLGREDSVVQLGHAIAGRGRSLVILDNFEQVARDAEATLGRWLDRCEEARFVVTTREVLGLPGEELVACDPLAQEDAEALFVLRARTARHAFDPNDDERRVIARLVTLLDRLPLAIELAAARVRVLTPQQVLERMGERFKLLSSSGARRDRQATLRVTLDWSWDLLSPWERSALAQISVFEGGFTLESAEDVVDLSACPEAPWTVDVVHALVDKSLVRPTAQGRFDLLVSVQEYAAEKLRTAGAVEGSGPAAELMAQQRHGLHFALRGQRDALEALDAHGGVARRRDLSLELENVVAACHRAVGRGDAETAMATLAAAWAVLRLSGPATTGLELGRAVTAMPNLAQRAPALSVLGQACSAHGRMDEARTCLETALAMNRERGNRRDEGSNLTNLGNLHKDLGSMDEAGACYEAALAIHREVSNRSAEGGTVNNLGNLHMAQGRQDEARECYERALAIHREVGNRNFEGITLCNLGMVNSYQLEGAAQGCMEAALAIHREVGNRRFEGITLNHLGDLHLPRGCLVEARASYEAALLVARTVGNRHSEGQVLGSLGRLNTEQGLLDEARTCYEAALVILREVRDPRSEGQVLGKLGNLHLTRGLMDEARTCLEAALALHREVGDRQFEGIAAVNLGYLHLEQGRLEEARACYEAALVLHRGIGSRGDEGIVLGHLGVLHARDGRFDEARAALAQGEALIRGVSAWLELGKVLCQRAEVEHRAGDAAAARTALSQAEALAERFLASEHSELARAIGRVRRSLGVEAGSSGER
jgi:predicted ATPase/predicted negative regulator of RcsB-dependent stress response